MVNRFCYDINNKEFVKLLPNSTSAKKRCNCTTSQQKPRCRLRHRTNSQLSNQGTIFSRVSCYGRRSDIKASVKVAVQNIKILNVNRARIVQITSGPPARYRAVKDTVQNIEVLNVHVSIQVNIAWDGLSQLDC